jgi:hypothetical protein
MLELMMSQLETDLRTALGSCVTVLLASVRSQLEDAIKEIERVRAEGLAVVVEQRAKAVAYVGAKRDDLQQEIESMHEHQEAQEGHIELNVGGHRFETSVQTLRRVPGSYFDTYFSGRYTQEIAADGSIFIDRDGLIFGHDLEFLSAAVQDERPSSGLLRRLKREFAFFSIESTEQAGGNGNVDFFDTMIAEAKRSEDEAKCGANEAKLLEVKASASGKPRLAKDETGAEVETTQKNDDGIIMNAVDKNGEVRLRNSRRRDLEGKDASAKRCNKCLQEKSLDEFHKCGSQVGGRQAKCKVCVKEYDDRRKGQRNKN